MYLRKCLLCSVNSSDICLIGDINIDILNITRASEEYLLLLSSLGYQSLIDRPTRVFNQSKTCIDHVFLKSKNFSGVYPFILELNITDHFATGLSFKNVFPTDNNHGDHDEISPSEQMLEVDFIKLKCYLSQESWAPVYSCDCPSDAFSIFLDILKNYISASTRVKQKQKIKKLNLG